MSAAEKLNERLRYSERTARHGWHLAGAGPARYGWAAYTAAGDCRYLGRTVDEALQALDARETIDSLNDQHCRDERRLVESALEACGWSLTATARRLDVTLPRLQRLIAAHGLGEVYAAKAPGPGRPRKMPVEETEPMDPPDEPDEPGEKH